MSQQLHMQFQPRVYYQQQAVHDRQGEATTALTAYIQGPSLHQDLAWGLAGLAPQSQYGLIAWPYLESPTLA